MGCRASSRVRIPPFPPDSAFRSLHGASKSPGKPRLSGLFCVWSIYAFAVSLAAVDRTRSGHATCHVLCMEDPKHHRRVDQQPTQQALPRTPAAQGTSSATKAPHLPSLRQDVAVMQAALQRRKSSGIVVRPRPRVLQ
ncbi:hypothetical protein VARIO8X_90354 [Burkholderiales bacterium 8X]|nr:hypothetical protein VARIO8X_90354 [Burkholderiales bacterium 8X]